MVLILTVNLEVIMAFLFSNLIGTLQLSLSSLFPAFSSNGLVSAAGSELDHLCWSLPLFASDMPFTAELQVFYNDLNFWDPTETIHMPSLLVVWWSLFHHRFPTWRIDIECWVIVALTITSKSKVKQQGCIQELHSSVNVRSDFIAELHSYFWILEKSYLDPLGPSPCHC